MTMASTAQKPGRRAGGAGLAAVLALVAATIVLPPLTSAVAEVPCTPRPAFTTCVQFEFTGADQAFVVPSGVSSLAVTVYGAQGEASWIATPGGRGGMASGTISTSPGTVYTVTVGAMGGDGTSYGGGGRAGTSTRPPGGDGGGLSALWSGPSFTADAALLVAGGGGGSSGSLGGAPSGGAGGGAVGGRAGSGTVGGGGGTESAGGAPAVAVANTLAGSPGSLFRGGDSANVGDSSGGAGGGGWYGGGAGLGQIAMTGDTNTSGGGGSGYLAPSVIDGAMSSGVRSGAGLVVIEFTPAFTAITSVTDGDQVGGTFTVAGTGTAGNTVSATLGGSPLCTTVVDAAGAWSCGLVARPPGAYAVSATEQNPSFPLAAYPSVGLTVTVVAPAAPSLSPSAGGVVSGSAQTGTNVTVFAPDGAPLGSAAVAPDGSFSITLSAVQPHGAVLSASADDGVNRSELASVTVDAVAPAPPDVAPTDGETVSGCAEPGATVVVRSPHGSVLGSALAGSDGAYLVSLSPLGLHAEVLAVTATDAAGNTSSPTPAVVDAVAPHPPALLPSDGHAVTGSAEPGSTVELRDPSGALLGTTTADPAGEFSIALAPRQPDGAVLAVTATDAAGNTSPAATATVDAEAPSAPRPDPTSGRVVSGEAEPGSTVTIRDPSGAVVGTGTAAPDGAFVIALTGAQPHGTVLGVVATDAAANTSDAALVTVDALAPGAPAGMPTDGRVVVGTAEPGSTVVVSQSDGTPIASATVLPDGSFSIDLTPRRADGERLLLTAIDEAGNESASSEVVVDASAPGVPSLAPTNGRLVTGTTEPGASVEVRDATGGRLGTGTAGADGQFTVVLATPQPHGSTVRVIASDAVGNESAAATVTVDALPPAPASVRPSNGRVVDGTAEPGARVEVRDSTGALRGTTVADGDGSFRVPLVPTADDGDVLEVIARDAADNASSPTTTVVDAAAPLQPDVEPTDGLTVVGMTEPGAIVVVRSPSGMPLGAAVAGPDGSFSIVLSPAQRDGIALQVTASDSVGNDSEPRVVVVAVPPPLGSVPVRCAEELSGAVTCSGQAEPGLSVDVHDSRGALVCSTVVTEEGVWSCTSSLPGAQTPLAVTFTDPRGPATVVDGVGVAARASGLAATGIDRLGDLATAVVLGLLGVGFVVARRRRVRLTRG